jgi:hypothetical protein
LQAASEIEHALMVQYLYAYYTSGSDEDSRVFLHVAIQEMGHLFTVQNLLRAFNQDVHLILPDPTMEQVKEAFPFPLLLQPASLSSLAQYVTAESPLAATLPPELKKIAEDAIKDAAIEVRHVGLLFLKLYWLTLPSSSPFGPWQPPLSAGWEADLGNRHLSKLGLDVSLQRSWKAASCMGCTDGRSQLSGKVDGAQFDLVCRAVPLATELLKRPLREGGGDLHAGPPFQAPASIPTDFDGIRVRLARETS